MSSSADYRTASNTTPIRHGQVIAVTIARGNLADRGTYLTTAAQHPGVPGLLVAEVPRGTIVVQRPNGDQPYPVKAAA